MDDSNILIAIAVVGLSILLPIYYSYKQKKQRSAEALERMQIREYGRKINDETRAKNIYR